MTKLVERFLRKLFAAVALIAPFVCAEAGVPVGSKGPPPTPTPFVTTSPPPGAPLLPPPGRPTFSVVTRDKGDHFEVYAVIGNASAKDVQVSFEKNSLKLSVPPTKAGAKPGTKLVTLPHSALRKVIKIERRNPAVIISIPKKK